MIFHDVNISDNDVRKFSMNVFYKSVFISFIQMIPVEMS